MPATPGYYRCIFLHISGLQFLKNQLISKSHIMEMQILVQTDSQQTYFS